MGGKADVNLRVHLQDDASKSAQKMFQELREDLKGVERQGKQTQQTVGGLGKLLGGLATLEAARKVATFTYELGKMSKEGRSSIENVDRAWGHFKISLGQNMQGPISATFNAIARGLDDVGPKLTRERANLTGFWAELGMLASGDLVGAATDFAARAKANTRAEAGSMLPTGKLPHGSLAPRDLLAKQIRQAQLDERINAIGEQVDQQIAADKEKKQRAAEERARKAAEFRAKKQKEFEEEAHRLGPGNIGKVMSRTMRQGTRPGLLESLMTDKPASLSSTLDGGKANIIGSMLGMKFSVGFKQGLKANKSDFIDPSVQLADDVAIDFRSHMIGVLGQSYEDLLHGDFEDALKGLGAGTLDGIVGGFTTKLADATVNSKFGQQLTDFVGKGTSAAVKGIGDIVSGGLDTGLDMNKLRSIGARAGGHLKTGAEAGFDFVLPDISNSWGPQGATFKAIQGGMTNALRGGIEGAAIGTMISSVLDSSEMTAKYTQIGASIGGAIGGAIGGPGGAGIGALIGSLAGQVWQTGASKQSEGDYKNLLTDVAAFGGAQGFFSRIGGLSGFTGNRVNALGGGNGEDFSTKLRLTQGMTEEQANAFVQLLKAQGTSTPLEVSDSIETQVLNVMRGMGFSVADISKATMTMVQVGGSAPVTGTGGNSVRLINPETGDTETEQERFDRQQAKANNASAPAGKLVVSSPSLQSQAAALLTRMFQNNTISRSALRTIGMDAISAAAGQMGGVWPQFVGPLRGVLAGSPQDETWMNSRGVDVVAARGYSQEINRPTVISVGGGPRILAGEAGRETLAVIPHGLRGRVTSAGQGAGGAMINLHLHVGNPIGDSTHAWVTREVYPILKQLLWQDSNNGTPLIRSKAVVA